MKFPIRTRRAPIPQTALKNPASDARPEKVAIENRKKTWTLPIHEIADGLSLNI